MPLFRGQGKVYAAVRGTDGFPLALPWLGNASELNVKFETEKIEHKESYTGQRLVDSTIITGKTASMSMRLDDFDLDRLALGLYGAKATITGAAVTAEVFPTVALNDEVVTKNPVISAVVIKDSAGTPATLTLGTHYTITDAGFGRVKFINLAAFVQPFKIDYTYATRVQSGMFTVAAPERWLRFEGLNTANGDKKVIVDLYKVQISPLSELALIGDEHGSYELTGSVLLDTTKADGDPLGKFGRVIDLA